MNAVAVRRYELRDVTGRHLATHVRRDKPDGGKAIGWEQPDGTQGLGGIAARDLPLYGIDKLGKAPEVVICEGEKAAEALWSIGIPAVGTVTGAASCPGRDVLAELSGRRAYLWPDNDDVGRAHMARIANELERLGITARLIEWADAPEHGDAADMVAAGATAEDVVALCTGSSPVEPPEPSASEPRTGWFRPSTELPTMPPPSDPMAVARRLVADRFTQRSALVLRSWRGDFYAFDGRCWRRQPEAAIRDVAYRFLEHAQFEDARGQLREWRPTRPKVVNLLEALRVVVRLDEAAEPPAWIDCEGPDPRGLIVVNNGILHLPTRELLGHDPRLFALVALPFDYNPEAAAPTRWLRFLNELWGDDSDSIELAQEIAGYAISGDTSLQKLILIVGPTRAGKGVYASVVSELVGRANVTAPTLAGLTTNFGLQDLIGKTLAVVSDARLGTKSNLSALTERLLSISGEDPITIDKKYRDPWTGRLGTRFLIATNELPRFVDVSQALAKRFVILLLHQSFYGREEPTLRQRLQGELPGVFNWALDGLDRLRAQGYFTEPATARETMLELEDLASPISAFVRDTCVVGPEARVVIDNLWQAWKSWCDEQGRHYGTLALFGRDLRAAVSGLRVINARDGDRRRREYAGLALRANNGLERVPGVPEPSVGARGTPGTRTAPLSGENGLSIEDDYPPSAFDGVDQAHTEGGR